MTGERGRGAVLYATAGVLVAAGAVWWFRAAPPERGADRVEQWRATVEKLLPEVEGQEDSSTMALGAGAEQTYRSSVETGKYVVSLVCRGGPDSFVRVSLSQNGSDSGLGLPCSEERAPQSFEVGLADSLRLHVVVGDAGPIVFRYSLARAR